MNWKIAADSSANLLEMKDISFCTVPLKIITDQREYTDDRALDVRGMVEDLLQYKGRSGSSCPNAHEWLEAFSGADAVIGLTISSNISGSFAAAQQAAEDYREECPNARVFILDSLSTGPEMQLLAEKARELILGGLGFEQVKARLVEYSRHTRLLFCLQSLKNLANNGRVSPAAATISGALGLRLVGTASPGGTLLPLHKCRGEAAALRTLVKEMLEGGWQGGKVRIAHCFNQKAASLLAESLRQHHRGCEIEILPTTALCSFYAEKGGLLVGFEGA